MTTETTRTEARMKRVVPASDIIEREDGFHILLDVPGVTRDNLTIEIEENELKVAGGFKRHDAEGVRFVHREFGDSEFARTFTLTDMVDKDKITASFNHGVLDLFLPRAEAAMPRRIEITG